MRADKKDAKLSRKIPTSEIQQVKMVYDPETITLGSSFHIITKERTFELQANTMKECQLWYRVLYIIVEMNKNGVSLKESNPFIYEEQQMKAL